MAERRKCIELNALLERRHWAYTLPAAPLHCLCVCLRVCVEN